MAKEICVFCGKETRPASNLTLHNISGEQGLLNENVNAYSVVPAACSQCARVEFFDREYMSEDKKLAYLLKKNTES